MKALRGSAEEKQLLQRYTRQLDEQETRLDALTRDAGTISQQLAKAREELAALIGQVPVRRHRSASSAVIRTAPAEAYFSHVDWIVARANELGLYIGFLPTWGDKWNKKWGVGPEIFTPANAEQYGEWLGRRYRDAALIWILGGDRPIENDTHRQIIRAMARGLRRGDGGSHLMTLHPTGGQSSSGPFHDDEWLDFNMRQNGHGPEFTGRYEMTRADYDRLPAKPVVDGEPIYEDHPVSFDAKKLGHSISSDVRRPLYWDLYAPIGRSFSVRMSVVKGGRVGAWWFNPRDGRATSIGTFANTGEREFTPPDPGEMLDWVLVLDEEARSYPPPGAPGRR